MLSVFPQKGHLPLFFLPGCTCPNTYIENPDFDCVAVQTASPRLSLQKNRGTTDLKKPIMHRGRQEIQSRGGGGGMVGKQIGI